MIKINKQLYEDSLDDIEFYIKSSILFTGLKAKYKYTRIEDNIDDILEELNKKIKDAVNYHKKTYGEEINVSIIKNMLKGVGMKIKDALVMVDYIEATRRKISDRDRDFINTIKISRHSRLTSKQEQYLKGIYQRVTE